MTGGPIEVAHIYPFSLNSHMDTTKKDSTKKLLFTNL